MNKLPQDMIQITIADLKVGEEAYTVPWAMWVDLECNMWLSVHFSYSHDARGTQHMRIRREVEGFTVYRSSIRDEQYSLTVGRSDMPCLPVTLK